MERDDHDARRRALLGGLAVGTVGLAAAPLGAEAAGAPARTPPARPLPVPAASSGRGTHGPIESRVLTFADPVDEFRAHFRFERDLRDESTVVSWYHFTVFVVPENARPVPVVRYEGMEFSYFRRVKDLVWRIHAHNVSFPRRLEDGQFATEIRNPVTGATVRPATITLTEDPGVLYGPRGYLPLDSREPQWLPSIRSFRIDGDSVVVDHTRPTPAGWPTQFIETSTAWASRRDFDDPRVTSLPCGTSGFYLSPWSKWLEMGERRGHSVSAWVGRKLGSIDELPHEFRSRVERERPDLLKPRWSEFDRTLPFEI
jgi:hypothetical protein